MSFTSPERKGTLQKQPDKKNEKEKKKNEQSYFATDFQPPSARASEREKGRESIRTDSNTSNGVDIQSLLYMNQESLNSKQRRLIRRYNERNVKDDTTSLAGITEDFTKQNKQTNIENNTNIDKKNVLQKDSGEGKDTQKSFIFLHDKDKNCAKNSIIEENIQQKSSNEKNIAEESLEGAEKTVQENIKEESSKSPKKKKSSTL